MEVLLAISVGVASALAFAGGVLQLNMWEKMSNQAATVVSLCCYGLVTLAICCLPWLGFSQPLVWWLWVAALAFGGATFLLFLGAFVYFTWGDDIGDWLVNTVSRLARKRS